MKNKLITFTMLIVLLCVLAGCACQHEWNDATCISPKVCALCEETEGEALGHSWNDATCTTPRTCAICGTTEGEAMAHAWEDATCTTPRTCALCNQTDGEAKNHEWIEATCTVEKTCADCAQVDGEPLGHEVTEWVTRTEPTCQTSGVSSAICVRCTEELEREIEILSHTESEWIVVSQATSTENGLRQITCTACGSVLSKEEIIPTDEEREQMYKNECGKYSYETIARNPDKYKGEKGYVYGKVIQVIEDGNDYTLRVAMNGSYSSVILVSYTKPAEDDRILEDDWVKMYGVWYGTYTYKSTLGASITVPLYFCRYLDIQ